MTIYCPKYLIDIYKKESKSIYLNTRDYPHLRKVWMAKFVECDTTKIFCSTYSKKLIKKEVERLHWNVSSIKGLKVYPIELMHFFFED